MAASRRSPELFIAEDDLVSVFDTPTGHGQCGTAKPKDMWLRPFEEDDSVGYLSRERVPQPSVPLNSQLACLSLWLILIIAIRNHKYARRRNRR